jgi:hypothetical protein
MNFICGAKDDMSQYSQEVQNIALTILHRIYPPQLSENFQFLSRRIFY